MMTNSRKDKRFISCPVCGRILMKCQGVCDLEIICGKCNSEMVVIVDVESVMMLENRRGNDRQGQGKVSVQKTDGDKKT